MHELAPVHCDLTTAIETARATARRMQQNVRVRWGAVSFVVKITDSAERAYAAYMASARELRAMEDAAKGRLLWSPPKEKP